MRRRDAIKTLGAIAGAAALPRGLGACGEASGPGTIDTYVFLMMENRSYDHYLGARSMLEGRGGDGLRPDMSNPDRSGRSVPIWPAELGHAMCVIDPPHGWDGSRQQFNGGRNDGFVVAHQETHASDAAVEPMQYMRREHLPVTSALADAYTSCDRWFCSVMGPTLPNRMFWHAGTSNGAKTTGDVLAGAFKQLPTLYHRLDAAGVDWAYYFGDTPVIASVDGLDFGSRLRRFPEFLEDASAGRLPPVVYIDPAFAWNDDHPPRHPFLGQQLLASVYQALATSPHWSRCQLVVTYDEHGGFFDHVPPPTVADDRAAEGFDQLGFRVPTLVIGPYARSGYVSSVQYDHTSALKHLQNTYGFEPLTLRMGAAADLSDCVDQERLVAGRPAAPITLPVVELDTTQLPPLCLNEKSMVAHHDVLEWAQAAPELRAYRSRALSRDVPFVIAEYLDAHGLGRIRRR